MIRVRWIACLYLLSAGMTPYSLAPDTNDRPLCFTNHWYESKTLSFLPNNVPPEIEFNQKNERYLNEIISNIERLTHKRMHYTVYISKSKEPNAYAYQENTIYVTSGLLEILQSETELVSILAHEIGHIELKHKSPTNKIQEADADEYAFRLLSRTVYDPRGEVDAFRNLKRTYDVAQELMDRYFSTHPPIEQRIEKFNLKAESWWNDHSDSVRYVGKRNFTERKSFFSYVLQEEWIHFEKK